MITTNYTIGDFPDAPRGWVCPKCGRVYSPNTTMCFYCGGTEPQITNLPNTTGVDPEWWKQYQTISSDKILKETLLSSDTFRVHFEDLPYYEEK